MIDLFKNRIIDMGASLKKHNDEAAANELDVYLLQLKETAPNPEE